MSEIVFEDDFAKVISVDNAEDIRKYTDTEFADDVVKYFEDNKDDGDFYLIHKSRQNQFYIFQESVSSIKYFNEEFTQVNVVEFKKTLRDYGFIGALKYINENIGGDDSDIYDAALTLSKGRTVNKNYIRMYNDNIKDITISERNPHKSVFILKFDDDEFFEILNLDEEEKYFIQSLYSYYGYQWSEGADLNYEWGEGYVLQNMNDENINKIKTVLINNGEEELSQLRDDEAVRNACSMLEDLYTDEIERIIREYGYAMDEASDAEAKKDVEKSYCNPFYRYRILMAGCMNSYIISALDLKKIYEAVGVPEMSVVEVLKEYFSEIIGADFNQNLSEHRYEYQMVDGEQFNRNIVSELDKMVSDSESEMDEDSGKIKEIIKKYGLRKDVKTPKGAFRINNYDLNNGTIDYSFNKDENYVGYNSERRRATLDDFNTFLNNYELFENKIIKLLQQLNEQTEISKDEQLTIDFLKTVPTDKKKPIIYLKDDLYKFNQNNNTNLNLDTLLKTTNKPGFPFKVDLFGVSAGNEQKIISTIDYKVNSKLTFTLTHNPMWDKNLYGFKFNL